MESKPQVYRKFCALHYQSNGCLFCALYWAFQNKMCVLSHLAHCFSSVKMKNTHNRGVEGNSQNTEFVCFFIVCVFLPRSLLPLGKDLDSKRTIYFEWPYHSSQFTLQNQSIPYTFLCRVTTLQMI